MLPLLAPWPRWPRRILFVSGGSGITPVLSMLRTLRAEGFTGEVARRNKLQLDRGRLMETMRLIASTYEEPEQVIEMYRNDPQLMQGLQNRVMEEQVIDWIAERARQKWFRPTSYITAEDAKLAICPPSSELSLFARRTIASAFQRM